MKCKIYSGLIPEAVSKTDGNLKFCKFNAVLFALLMWILMIPNTLDAQSFNLNGYWKSDAGGMYQIRQKGNEVVWVGEPSGTRVAQNVFHGAVSGNTLGGLWYDLPSNPAQAFGSSISLRIENDSRMVKVSESDPYNGTVWTRTTNIPMAVFEPNSILGLWDWPNGSSQLEMFPNGTFITWVNGKQTNSGTWVCTNVNERSYTLRHQIGGWIDNMVLSTDFKTLTGKNQYGNTVTARRLR